MVNTEAQIVFWSCLFVFWLKSGHGWIPWLIACHLHLGSCVSSCSAQLADFLFHSAALSTDIAVLAVQHREQIRVHDVYFQFSPCSYCHHHSRLWKTSDTVPGSWLKMTALILRLKRPSWLTPIPTHLLCNGQGPRANGIVWTNASDILFCLLLFSFTIFRHLYWPYT